MLTQKHLSISDINDKFKTRWTIDKWKLWKWLRRRILCIFCYSRFWCYSNQLSVKYSSHKHTRTRTLYIKIIKTFWYISYYRYDQIIKVFEIFYFNTLLFVLLKSSKWILCDHNIVLPGGLITRKLSQVVNLKSRDFYYNT